MANALKKLLSLSALAGAALMATTSAHALLTVPSGGSASQPFRALIGTTYFYNSYSFTLGGLSDLTGFALPSNVNSFSAYLSNSGTHVTIPLSDVDASRPGLQFFSPGLTPGDYSLIFTGDGTTRHSGYGGKFSITAAVPEPSTIALALAAAGLLGGLAWRKRSRS